MTKFEDAVDIGGVRYTRVSVHQGTGMPDYIPIQLGTGAFEILVASIRPYGAAGLGVSNASINLKWEHEGITYNTWLASGFVAQHHNLVINKVIVFGPVTLQGWVQQYAIMPRRFEVIYRRVEAKRGGLFG